LYFTSNQNSNKLYLNKGDFKFEDITAQAGVMDSVGWTTGTTMIDINGDGWLDIYVCKSASLEITNQRRNLLYLNQKDNTFIESASLWGIADPGFSTQAYFFDMDKDHDLDLYLVNHRVDFNNNGTIRPDLQKKIITEFSDRLYRNEGGHFTDITRKAGVENRAWGLSASIGDFNGDNWPDIYVCNDFLEPDHLYINNKNGTFSDEILSTMRHISFNSMGSDYADFNNDLLPDLVALDMTPADHVRSKTNMSNMSTANFKAMVDNDFHHQYMINVLQMNVGKGKYSEISQLSDISKTDWSWAPLLADFDNDNKKDLLVTNGILKDLSNRDFRNMIKAKTAKKEKISLKELLNKMPSEKIPNSLFHNQGDLTFKDKSIAWGLETPSHSNGAAYGDLDNDGDLDLVINNLASPAFIYRNNSNKNFLQINLIGPNLNPNGLGTRAIVSHDNIHQSQEMYTARGYLSSVHNRLHFGLGYSKTIDSLKIIWPDGKVSFLKDINANQKLDIKYADATNQYESNKKEKTIFRKIDPRDLGIDFVHQENDFDDYKDQVLLPHSQSKHGPFIEKGDVNKDGLEDFFVGGAAGQSGELYIQKSKNKFKKVTTPFANDSQYEDLGIIFFDYDGDEDVDLYLVSGGAEFPENSDRYFDRLYKNDGLGNFTKTTNALPEISVSGMIVRNEDIDGDGDQDLFIGGRILPNKYPYSPQSYFLVNENGVFSKSKISTENMGMITGAEFSDIDGDGDKDLITVGEWAKIKIHENENGTYRELVNDSLTNTIGLWSSITKVDLDNDGDEDFILGNLGKNTKYKANETQEFHIHCNDFDVNGTYDIILSNTYKNELVPVRGKQCTSEQMPAISESFPSYDMFAKATTEDIIGKNLTDALHFKADILESCYLTNHGNKNFSLHKLPNFAQDAPISDAIAWDYNNKAYVLLVGNNYHSETETVRYDASVGHAMTFENSQFKKVDGAKSGIITSGDTRKIIQINKDLILVTNNSGSLDIFSKK